MNNAININQENNTIVLWHGGRDLEHSYMETKESTKGRWEHGPGLYLTTHYETARKYAKGGGKTYKVHIENGVDIRQVNLKLDDVLDFASKYVIKKIRNQFLEDIFNNSKRMKNDNQINAEYFLNLCINHNAVIGKNTIRLNHFLIENGVDYGISERFAGRDETILVLFNLKKINKISAISAKDVSLDDYELPIFLTNKNKLKP